MRSRQVFHSFALALMIIATITVSGCGGASGDVSTPAGVAALPSAQPTDTLIPPTDTPQPTTTPTTEPTRPPEVDVVVDIPCCHVDAQGDDGQNQEDEWVCFKNQADVAANMTGWTVVDEYGWTYTFPDFTLGPGATVRVVTGCGTNTADTLYWCKGGSSAVWNNDGDTVYLYGTAGDLVAEYGY